MQPSSTSSDQITASSGRVGGTVGANRAGGGGAGRVAHQIRPSDGHAYVLQKPRRIDVHTPRPIEAPSTVVPIVVAPSVVPCKADSRIKSVDGSTRQRCLRARKTGNGQCYPKDEPVVAARSRCTTPCMIVVHGGMHVPPCTTALHAAPRQCVREHGGGAPAQQQNAGPTRPRREFACRPRFLATLCPPLRAAFQLRPFAGSKT